MLSIDHGGVVASCIPQRTIAEFMDSNMSHSSFMSKELAHCSLGLTWKQILELRKTAKGRISTGGLGKKIIPGLVKVWVCDRDSECSTANSPMCFVFEEAKEHFIPWGLKSKVLPARRKRP